jgi:hypothetical protein
MLSGMIGTYCFSENFDLRSLSPSLPPSLPLALTPDLQDFKDSLFLSFSRVFHFCSKYIHNKHPRSFLSTVLFSKILSQFVRCTDIVENISIPFSGTQEKESFEEH